MSKTFVVILQTFRIILYLSMAKTIKKNIFFFSFNFKSNYILFNRSTLKDFSILKYLNNKLISFRIFENISLTK